ncbi:MAG: cytochrome C biogenesis protein, partial [Usitatibacter sp.]
MAWRASRPALAGGPSARGDMRLENVVVPVALVLHGMLLYRRVVVADGLDLGVANAVSMLVWLTVIIYWLGGLAFQGLTGILGLMSPVALLAVLLQAAVPTHHIVTYGGDPLFTLHFAIAMLAYSLYIVATVHAVVMLAEEKWLHRGVLPPFL